MTWHERWVKQARTFLDDDRGESSIMSAISQNVAAFALIPMMGVVATLSFFAGQMIADQDARTALGLGSEQFASDVQNQTAIIPVSDHMVGVLSNHYAKDTGQLMQSTATQTASNTACRVSVWYINSSDPESSTGVSVENITSWRSSAACDPASASILTPNAIKAIAANPGASDTVDTVVASADPKTELRYFNAAQRQMTYANGTTDALDVYKTASASGKTDKNGWYTPSEYAFGFRGQGGGELTSAQADTSVPNIARVELFTNTDVEVTGNNSDTYVGNTGATISELSNTNVGTPTTPTQTVFVPNPVTGIIAQRCTTGEANGTTPKSVDPSGTGYPECVTVSWNPRPAAECDVSQTLTYNVLLHNQDTGATQTDVRKTYLVGSKVSVPGAWNGDSYTVTVTAQCFTSNDAVDKSTPKSISFDQSLPAPRPTIAFGSAETTHNVTWTKSSSDPRTNYEVEYLPYSSGLNYTQQTETGNNPRVNWLPDGKVKPSWKDQALSPPTANSETYTGRTTRPGFPDAYQVRASVPIAGQTDGSRIKSTYGASSIVYSINASGTNGTNVTGSTGDPTTTIQATGDPTDICPAGTSYAYVFERHKGKNGASISQWVSPNVSGWAARSSVSVELSQGDLLVARNMLACYTKFVPLPDADRLNKDGYNKNLTNSTSVNPDQGELRDADNGESYMQYNSKPMNRITLSRWDWYFRPISAPAAPANLHNDAIGSGEGGVARDAWNGVSCSAGNSVAYNTWVAAVNADAGHYADSGWITATVRGIAHSEAPGSRYDWRVRAKCQSDLPSYDLPSGVSAHNETIGGTSSDWYVTDVPGPSGDASASVSSINAGNYYTESWSFTCHSGNNPVGGGSQSRYAAATGYGGGYYMGGTSHSGYCEGYWRGTGAKNSGSASVTTPSVYVVNPPPPVPAAPEGISFSAGQTRICQDGKNWGFTIGSNGLSWNAVSYATSYEVVWTYIYGNGGETATLSDSLTTSGTSATISTYREGATRAIDITITAIGPGGRGASTTAAAPATVGGCLN